MEEFKLTLDEQITVDIFYTSLEIQPTFGRAIYKLDTSIIKELTESEKLDFMFTLKVCKRLLLVENKKLDSKN
jgi:hypothetical protein